MPDLLAGTTLSSGDTPPTQSSQQSASYTFTITTFGVATSGGTYVDCAVVFTAPTTGRVKIHLSGRLLNSTTAGTLLVPETRTGATIGSGTVVEATNENNGISNYSASFARPGCAHLLTGLTPGAVYNTRLLHRVSAASTGTIALRELIVEPAT